MVYKEVTINSSEGLNATTAAVVVQLAGKYASKVLIEKGNKKINAKSIMGVLSLGVKPGDEIFIVADGDDEEAAMEAVVQIFE
ncbi:MAG: HPr family phosphocarrier protein [Eubacteriales bacterium]